ncbi:glycosyltransferase [Propionibacteriaceae bacterium G1746]|uniref:glycosyltransferase n=1 Tax=Aestuariimicrobium sp. G57 TaxID=3418485 RepID=UPI003C17F73E
MIIVCGRGVPTPDAPLLGLFELDQTRALHDAGRQVVYCGLDVRSLRRWRRWGLVHGETGGVPTVTLNAPLGRLPHRLKLAVMRRLWDVLLGAAVRRHGRPEVVHGHFLAWTAPLAGARLVRGTPLVVTEHWSRLSGAIDAEVRDLGRAVYGRAAAVLAVSSPLAATIEREFGITAQVVPDMIDVDTFAPVAAATREPGVRLVTCGNLIARKNIDGLLRAFAAVAPAAATLTVIGQGPERAALEALTGQLGISDRVRFTGRLSREQMAAEYARATGFALASHAETFGMVWAEALAAGLPVLATRCGGPEDFVGDDNGVLVSDDPDAIASGLGELCAGITAGRWSSGELSRQAGERFSPQAVTGQVLTVYAGSGG